MVPAPTKHCRVQLGIRIPSRWILHIWKVWCGPPSHRYPATTRLRAVDHQPLQRELWCSRLLNGTPSQSRKTVDATCYVQVEATSHIRDSNARRHARKHRIQSKSRFCSPDTDISQKDSSLLRLMRIQRLEALWRIRGTLLKTHHPSSSW